MKVLNLGSGIINTYLVELDRGWLMIDTGYPEGFNGFIQKLAAYNIPPCDIRYIFLTHAHNDHAGFLNQLLGCCKAKVILHEQAIPWLQRGQICPDGGCTDRLSLLFCNLMKAFGKGEHRFPPVESRFEDRYIIFHTGDSPENVLDCRIIETPGHSSCSISLLLDNGLLFCGDAAMNGYPSKHRTTTWAQDMNAYASSWEKIISLNPSMIYPGHGNPFPFTDLKRYYNKMKRNPLLHLK